MTQTVLIIPLNYFFKLPLGTNRLSGTLIRARACVQFHPSGQAFATGSEDTTARLFDLRSDQQLAEYKAPNGTGFTSCALSSSGRYILCGGLDNSVHIWDAMKNQHNCKSSLCCTATHIIYADAIHSCN